VLTVVLGLAVLSVLVIFHELGHLVIARRLGIRVERFSIGFGPTLFSRMVRGIQFAVSAFPLGGYVKMGGDDPRHRELLQPGDFFAASWWRRVLVALAGPGANFVLAAVLSVLLLWIGVHVPDQPNRIGAVAPASLADSLGVKTGDRIVAVAGTPTGSLMAVQHELGLYMKRNQPLALTLDRDGSRVDIQVPASRVADTSRNPSASAASRYFFSGLEFPIPAEVGEVVLGTPAYKAGMMVGDKIVAVDGQPVSSFRDLQDKVSVNAGKELHFTVLRGGRTIEIPIVPFADPTESKKVGKVGITAASPSTYLIRRSFSQGLVEGLQNTVATVGFLAKGIVSLFTSPSNLSQISGPVAIIQAGGDAAKAGWDRLLDRAIMFSIALMVFNLLPIPILDGGMIVLSLIEAVRRRPVGQRGLAVYQGIGLAVMGTLLVFVLINDPLRILQRRSALGRITPLP
jgi:regulator of sigma E protease